MLKKLEDLQKKLDGEKKELLDLEEDFKKQSMMLSLDAQEDKKRELDKKKRYVKYIFEEYSQQMKDAEFEAAQQFMKEIKESVRRIAEKEGYIMVFEKRTPGLIVYDDKIDITDAVAREHDAQKR